MKVFFNCLLHKVGITLVVGTCERNAEMLYFRIFFVQEFIPLKNAIKSILDAGSELLKKLK